MNNWLEVESESFMIKNEALILVRFYLDFSSHEKVINWYVILDTAYIRNDLSEFQNETLGKQ